MMRPFYFYILCSMHLCCVAEQCIGMSWNIPGLSSCC